MPGSESSTDLERDLSQALDDLHASLKRASEATAAIKSLLPRLAAAGSLFEEMESLIRAGRERIGVSQGPTETTYTRPTLVVPSLSTPRPTPVLQPSSTFDAPTETRPEPEVRAAATAQAETAAAFPPKSASEGGLVSFRLEFESSPGPLDLRTVDNAVNEHPAVRDVALLDYDGRRATLKVWITDAASPAEVQDALKEHAASLFGSAHEVTIVALEDVA
jgi:hypothetical protein